LSTQQLMNVTSGFFGKGDMQKEFEEASFVLQPGDVSPVIETASGLHIIERYVMLTLSLRSVSQECVRQWQDIAWFRRMRLYTTCRVMS
jgi:hypothetical protein